MGCNQFANHHFQMGVTAMGFAEDFGLSYLQIILTHFPVSIGKKAGKWKNLCSAVKVQPSSTEYLAKSLKEHLFQIGL